MLEFKIWLNTFLEAYGIYSASLKTIVVMTILLDIILSIYLVWRWFFRTRVLNKKIKAFEKRRQFEILGENGKEIVNDEKSGLRIILKKI